jgi:hypothetical protein
VSGKPASLQRVSASRQYEVTTSGLLGKYLHDTMPSKTFDWNPGTGSVEAHL